MVTVVAPTAAQAANAVLDEFGAKIHRPLTVVALGPRGGCVERHQGWFMATARAVGLGLFAQEEQLPLSL